MKKANASIPTQERLAPHLEQLTLFFWTFTFLGHKKGPRSFPQCLLAGKFTATFNQVRLTFPAFAYYPASPARRSLSSLSSRPGPFSLTCQSISVALFRVPHYFLFLILWLTRSTAETPFDISSGFVFIHSLPMPDFRLILWVAWFYCKVTTCLGYVLDMWWCVS